jgi:hypothetical protein
MEIEIRPSMNTDPATLAKDVSPRARGLFLKNLAEFQTELARVQAGFIPGLAVWQQRKELPMLVFRSLRRVQELRLRGRELGLMLGDVHLSEAVAGRQVLGELCHAKTPADLFRAGMMLVPEVLITAIDDYLQHNNSVYDLPSVPLLEANRDELNAQSRWAETALATLANETAQQPEPGYVEKVRKLTSELPGVLQEHIAKSATPVRRARRMGVLPLANSVLPRGFQHLEFGPSPLPADSTYAQRERYHAMNFLQEVQAADTCASLLFEAPDMPWDFYFDLGRQMWDEARHSMFGENKLAELGSSAAQAGLSAKAYALRQTLLPADRYAALSTQEADAFPGKHAGLKDAVAHGDRLSAMAWSYDIADETQHVRYGNKWIPVLIERTGEPRSFEQVKADARNWRQTVLAEVYKPVAAFFASEPYGAS